MIYKPESRIFATRRIPPPRLASHARTDPPRDPTESDYHSQVSEISEISGDLQLKALPILKGWRRGRLAGGKSTHTPRESARGQPGARRLIDAPSLIRVLPLHAVLSSTSEVAASQLGTLSGEAERHEIARRRSVPEHMGSANDPLPIDRLISWHAQRFGRCSPCSSWPQRRSDLRLFDQALRLKTCHRHLR